MKAEAEPQEPQQPEYTELRPEQVKVADLPVKPVPAGSAVEPVKVQLAALPSTDDVGVAPQVAAGASTTPITAQSVAEDSVHESNSLLDVAQQRALSGALAYAPQEREDDRAWHSAGSFGSNLRHGR